MTTLTTIARETVNLPALFAIRMEQGWTGCRSPLPGISSYLL